VRERMIMTRSGSRVPLDLVSRLVKRRNDRSEATRTRTPDLARCEGSFLPDKRSCARVQAVAKDASGA
jgi:hypothetical protein